VSTNQSKRNIKIYHPSDKSGSGLPDDTPHWYDLFVEGWELLKQFLIGFWYSFPVQLLLLHIKKNQLILVLWLLLLGIITQSIGSGLGVPMLFLEPEYLNEVSGWSFFVMGITLGTFTLSYQITCYILDAPRFSFLGVLSAPFWKFLINNAFIPLLFMGIYTYKLWRYELYNEQLPVETVVIRIAALWAGFTLAGRALLYYFLHTNKDVFNIFAEPINRTLKRTKMVRVNVFQRLQIARQHPNRVDYYLNNYLQPCKTIDPSQINSYRVLKVFDQNHQNGVIIQFVILGLVLAIGTFRDYPFFQIPAAASLVFLFTIVLMITGALSYWLRGWTFSFTVLILLSINILTERGYISPTYQAYGLNYATPKADYTLQNVRTLSNDEQYRDDVQTTLVALNNWRKKFPPNVKPKMVFVCASGGGQRAAVWAMRTLQTVDSTLNGRLMKHTMLMTGASGGMVGMAYFRELYLRQQQGRLTNPYDTQYLDNIAKDNLNAIMFSLVVNDLFFGFQTFEYGGYRYYKDRGHAFEQQLNRNTGGMLDKPLCDYREPELLSQIPMMMLTPTIVNDGRKLIISPVNASYMTVPTIYQQRFLNQKTKGIEFLRFFKEQDAGNLRFLTALRMSATFPYVTPNIKLPSEPAMQIMDAGVSDNFGISDAVRFLFTFRKWIQENTSGVVFVSIRDTQKDKPIEKSIEQSLFQRIFTPVSSLFVNLEYVQDIQNDTQIEFAQSWLGLPVYRVEFQYVPISKNMDEVQERYRQWQQLQTSPAVANNDETPKIIRIERAPLSWHLADKDKENIKRTIFEIRNQLAIRQLKALL
jgi:hypothetical protein